MNRRGDTVKSPGKKRVEEEDMVVLGDLKMAKSMSMRGVGVNKPYRTQCFVTVVATTTKGVDYNLVTPLAISTFGDLSSFASLYNEIRFVRGVAHVTYASFFPTVASGITNGIVVYDPVSSAPLTTATSGMVYPHKTFFHFGYYDICGSVSYERSSSH